jgi:hypothetical protein
MVRAVSVAPSAAAIENPRLMIALIAVTDAQTMNGSVIQSLVASVFEKSGSAVPADNENRRRVNSGMIRLAADHALCAACCKSHAIAQFDKVVRLAITAISNKLRMAEQDNRKRCGDSAGL